MKRRASTVKKAVWATVLGVLVLGISVYVYKARTVQRSLRKAASRTTKLVVETRAVIDGIEGVQTIEVPSREDVAAFFDVLRPENNSVFSHRVCACSGNPHIHLHDGNGQFATISIHHGDFIRCSWHPGNVDIREDMIPKVKQYFALLGIDLDKLGV